MRTRLLPVTLSVFVVLWVAAIGTTRLAVAQSGTATGGSSKGGNVTSDSTPGGSATAASATSGTVSSSTATASVNGREIKVAGESSVSINHDGQKAVVSIGSHKLVFEKGIILLDGAERAKIPADASKIEVTEAKGHVTVRAEGKEVFNAKLAKTE